MVSAVQYKKFLLLVNFTYAESLFFKENIQC